MKVLKEISNFNFAYTTDLLIFGIDSRENANVRSLPKKYFSILLVKRNKEPFEGKWCLPGGYVLENETSSDSSIRVLKKETGLTNVYMEQLRVNDSVDRDPRGRTISVSYMALIDRTQIKDELTSDASWFDIDINEENNLINIILTNGKEVLEYKVQKEVIDLKSEQYQYNVINNELGFDHSKIIIEGLMALRDKVNNTDIVFNLMPEYFTIGALKQVYELLLGHKLINSAFRRVIADRLIVTDKMIKTGGHRPSQLCKYKERK